MFQYVMGGRLWRQDDLVVHTVCSDDTAGHLARSNYIVIVLELHVLNCNLGALVPCELTKLSAGMTWHVITQLFAIDLPSIMLDSLMPLRV
jgi:hypothetical protein